MRGGKRVDINRTRGKREDEPWKFERLSLLSPLRLRGIYLDALSLRVGVKKPGSIWVGARTTKLYHEFLKNTVDRTRSSSEVDVEVEVESDDLLHVTEEEVVYQDKEIISDLNSAERTIQDRQADEIQTCRDSDSNGEVDSGFPKVYRRSQSEKMKEEDSTKTMRQKFLRRSETEKMYVGNP
ncbi:putative TRNA--methyltransferase non-catalytic subunit trm6MTase subunit trm6 [Senna tora]|uniref:Putative TRNA--methyltransferase non-catalytic subunit trm6MTase subunit trm6 n=1 Tax=Senna tora TaxID=362788 RepID=A0A834WXN8_9FABA|nr:putative TRNA--methyltransferase non-catalytic subunit trm6MTase subunit trm6 [Senna tora]